MGSTSTVRIGGDTRPISIDYRGEPGPFWLVFVDDTPVAPDMPLPLEFALAEFREEASTSDGAVVELRQCTADDLEWAGVLAAVHASEDAE